MKRAEQHDSDELTVEDFASPKDITHEDYFPSPQAMDDSLPPNAGDEYKRESLASLRPARDSRIMTTLILISHGLMLWGQIAELWSLAYVFGGQITVDPARDFLNPINITLPGEEVVLTTFTYWDSISSLWLVDRWVSKLTACLIFWLSCAAPHLKLIILHIYYYATVPKKSRRNAFYWISSLGKLSLVDVCLTCLLFALLNISFAFTFDTSTGTPDAIVEVYNNMANVFVNVTDLSEPSQAALANYNYALPGSLQRFADTLSENNDTALWDPLLAESCGAGFGTECPVVSVPSYPEDWNTTLNYTTGEEAYGYIPPECNITLASCEQCNCFMQSVLYEDYLQNASLEEIQSIYLAKMLIYPDSPKPAQDVELPMNFYGDVFFNIVLNGYVAFTGFALNVFASIAASMWANQVEDEQTAKESGITVSERLKKNTSYKQSMMHGEPFWRKVLAFLMPIFTVLAISIPIYRYTIAGLLPQLAYLNPEGSITDLSLITLAQMVGSPGNAFLNFFSFMIAFIAIGLPLLRVILLVIVAFIPLRPLRQFRFAKAANELGAITAWEALVLAIFFGRIQMPAVSGTTIILEVCNSFKASSVVKFLTLLIQPNDIEDCFWILIQSLPSILVLLIAWILIVHLNKHMWDKAVRVLEPFGPKVPAQGPGCCNCCHDCECGRPAEDRPTSNVELR
jgi:uncharacterized paraquat-inducible protein A